MKIAVKSDAKCIQQEIDGGFFFPSAPVGRPTAGNAGNQLDRIQRERAEFCNGTQDGMVCSYKQQCFEMGMLNEEPGVWGGTTEVDRRVALRRIRRQEIAL